MISPVQEKMIDAMLTPARLGAELSASIAAKSMDAQRAQGASVLKLLDGAAKMAPAPGDALVAKATGLGGLLDTTA
jgi:hypothetical protein